MQSVGYAHRDGILTCQSRQKSYLIYSGEIVEIDMFCEGPLVVGEVTIMIEE